MGWHEAVVAGLSAELGPGAMVTTNGLDSVAAFRASGVMRPFVVLPAWFNDETVSRAVQYYTALGFSPAGHLRYDPGRKWRDLPPGDLYPQGMGFEQEVEPLYQQIRALCPADADGVFIAGTGFRCVAILDELEADLRKPVLSANQVSLWHCLRLSGVHSRITGYGRLLSL
jgi:maleate isomerase